MGSPPPRTVVLVGAGPVGCLAAIAFAKRGWTVRLLEARPDLRAPTSVTLSQRSINLAISHRGIAALQAIDRKALEGFLECAIPMKGRMIHLKNGALDSQIYDKDGQCINSIDRALLNNLFPFDFCVGADGSYSIVRRAMMKVVRMNYQQEYISDEYVETRIPAGMDVKNQPTYLLDPNHLHIWPRHSFMLIALPNKDKSFTCTLFAPPWFERHFPDVLPLIGREAVVADIMNNPRNPLICTKSNPYHYRDRGILLGDAAHSMVPFYGQGLNCGLEDVRILDALLAERGVSPFRLNGQEDHALSAALEFYSTNPRPPSAWLPLYTMVTFRPDISYATAKRRAHRQSTILTVLAWTNIAVLLTLGWHATGLLKNPSRYFKLS
ncbi:FAD/NAD-binding domain-containing protein [Flagelloscypha sp. PMI_526]|nr:FAD/NAD-binding domain-containing protein [Flagelloscypha sp. PMI_526]